MPATFDKLASVTLTSSGAISLTSIPSTYTDLFIVGQLRAAGGSTVENCWWQVNGVTTETVYNDMRMIVYGSPPSNWANNSSNNLTENYIGAIAGNADGNNQYTPFTLNLNNYSNTSVYKPSFGYWAVYTYERGFRNGNFMKMGAGTAINSITFNCAGGSNFAAGSSVTIYGIRSA